MPQSTTACRCFRSCSPNLCPHSVSHPCSALFVSFGGAPRPPPCSCTRLQFHHPRFSLLCLPPECLRSRCEWMSTCSHPLTTRVQFCQRPCDCCSPAFGSVCGAVVRSRIQPIKQSVNQSTTKSILICLLAKSQPKKNQLAAKNSRGRHWTRKKKSSVTGRNLGQIQTLEVRGHVDSIYPHLYIATCTADVDMMIWYVDVSKKW